MGSPVVYSGEDVASRFDDFEKTSGWHKRISKPFPILLPLRGTDDFANESTEIAELTPQ